MVSIKTLYYDVARIVKGVCDKTYYQDRPTAIDEKVNSYLVISLPSSIVNQELDPRGGYRDYTTTLLLEVYVRDKMAASNPIGIDLAAMDEKVSKVVKLIPFDTDNIHVTQPEVVLNDNDDSGFHVTLIRARLRTK